jgi:hypothetical protein
MISIKRPTHPLLILLRPVSVQISRHSTFNTVPTTSFHHIFVSPQLNNIMALVGFSGPQLNTPGHADLMIYAAGIQLASQVQLSPRGLDRIEDALKNLPRSLLFESSNTCIGFEEESYVQTFAATQHGKTLLALCGCRTAVHSESMTAQVLVALCY